MATIASMVNVLAAAAKMPDRSNLREEGLVLAQSLKAESFMVAGAIGDQSYHIPSPGDSTSHQVDNYPSHFVSKGEDSLLSVLSSAFPD